MVPLSRLFVLDEALGRGDWDWLSAAEPEAAAAFRHVGQRPRRVNPSLYANFVDRGEVDRYSFWHDVPGASPGTVLAYAADTGHSFVWDGRAWSADPAVVDPVMALVRVSRDDLPPLDPWD